MTFKHPFRECAVPLRHLGRILRVFVTDDNSWTEHCSGLVSVAEPQKSANIIEGDVQTAAEKKSYTDFISEAEEKCVKDMGVEEFYAHFTNLGLEYGTTFANMTKARSAADPIVSLFKSHFALKRDRSRTLDVEYAEKNRALKIPRIVENNAMN